MTVGTDATFGTVVPIVPVHNSELTKYKILKILSLKQNKKIPNTEKKTNKGEDRTRTRKGAGPIQERVQYQDKCGSIPVSLLPTQEVSR